MLLRDCDNGGVVVFTKVPSNPSRFNITKALQVFGEKFDGQMACEQEEDDDVRSIKYYYDDDDDNNHY